MAVTLIGEVVNAADSATGFNDSPAISGDDDFVEGTGALGKKASSTTVDFYTTSLGAGAPYDFSVGGTEEGYHLICWFNTKTPVNATTGLNLQMGNGTSRGKWYVIPSTFYKGGFITRVISPQLDFDVIDAGSWTTGGNPAQLTSVSQVGPGFVTITSIMGSFNNVQFDQFTIGLGCRVDAGTTGTPNTFETIRAQDEDNSYWGWFSSSDGAVRAKGGVFMGPAAGSTTSVFDSLGEKVVFANERVSDGFYTIEARGAGTDVTFELINISSADSSAARWDMTLDSTLNSFEDTNGVWSGARILTLESMAILTGTTFADCNQIIQNGATLDGITVLAANTADGVAFIESDDPSLISDGSFTFSDGHAIEITTAGTYTFTGNSFSGYSGTTGSNLTPSSGSNDAAIYNNSGGLVTINIAGGGDTPSVRNAASSTTQVNNNTSVTLTGMKDNSEVRVYDNAALNSRVELAGIENATAGSVDNRSFAFSLGSAVVTNIVVFSLGWEPVYYNEFTIPALDTSIPVSQKIDRTYENP